MLPLTNRRFRCSALGLSLALLLAAPAPAQDFVQDLREVVARPAVSGYEHWLADALKAKLARLNPQSDNLGNVWVTLGSGSPHRLLVTPMDEPEYIVSAITEDGLLRLQRLPQQAPHPLFDQLHAAQPVVIQKRDGSWIYGVVAGLSTHLQPGRRDAPPTNHPDELYVDIGASSAAEVARAGVNLLDPLGLDRQLHSTGFLQLTAPAIGDRFGLAALLELARRLDSARLKGTVTLAFVAQHWTGARGLDRLTQHLRADELIFLGRLIPRRGVAPSPTAPSQPPPRQPAKEPGSGVLIASANPDAPLEGLPADLKRAAEAAAIPHAVDFSAPLPRAAYTRGPELPARLAHLAIATAWSSTPAELIDARDLDALAGLLAAYLQSDSFASRVPAVAPAISLPSPGPRPRKAPTFTEILKALVESYGISGHEEAVRQRIESLLPEWAKTQTDESGNLILRWKGPTTAEGARKKPERILFVAHSDEIGYSVERVLENGRLEVRSRGGGIAYFFAGHPVFVHTRSGIRPGVLELPAGWDQPNFDWPRGADAAALRVDVGARSPAQVRELGIAPGDWITIPKKYRPLLGARANGRSFDDRVGCAALVAAAWALGPELPGREVTFLWASREEVGLLGALEFARRAAESGESFDYVFAVDTFVSADSPLESPRYAVAPLGKGFVIRAVDNSTIARRDLVDRLVALARYLALPVQFGVTSGGNDGAAFVRHGALNIPIGWPLRYSHSPGEVIDTRDGEALSRIVAALARSWPEVSARAGSRAPKKGE
jgi:putative aminopeptidase FrvX